jgi:hypothetical protein
MTWTVDHPRHHWWRSERATVPVSWAHHPLRAAGTGLLVVIIAAWAGIVAFVGPQFGFRPTALSSWQWSYNNWLLHLLPGAAGVLGGLLILGRAPMPRARLVGWLSALIVVAAGAWLVIGPAAWGLFQSSDAFNTSVSGNRLFLFQVGANLGPGILLAVLGGLALKPGVGMPALVDAPGTAPAGRTMAERPVRAERPGQEPLEGGRVAGRTEAVRTSDTDPTGETRHISETERPAESD